MMAKEDKNGEKTG